MMVAKRPTITVVFETKTTRVTLLTREMNCSFSPVAVPKAESQQNLPQLQVLLSFLFFLGCFHGATVYFQAFWGSFERCKRTSTCWKLVSFFTSFLAADCSLWKRAALLLTTILGQAPQAWLCSIAKQ